VTHCEGLALLEQCPDFGLEGETLFLAKISESKRLQVPLRSPHGKQHGRFASHGAGAEVHGQADGDAFVEAVRQFEQPSGDRNPKNPSPELPSIFELNGGGSGS